MPCLLVKDETAFAKTLGLEMKVQVVKVAKAMCKYTNEEHDEPCVCRNPGEKCYAFGLYGYLAHAAILAMKTNT